MIKYMQITSFEILVLSKKRNSSSGVMDASGGHDSVDPSVLVSKRNGLAGHVLHPYFHNGQDSLLLIRILMQFH